MAEIEELKRQTAAAEAARVAGSGQDTGRRSQQTTAVAGGGGTMGLSSRKASMGLLGSGRTASLDLHFET
jgi:hypothetical protein